ncbi:hypothetical protein BC941DRAFT_471522 [Chlamydoabsidia padenii]|nr:hypothetical protein BC941DRAFT_471522 [Chlamydoabsidia padenii]
MTISTRIPLCTFDFSISVVSSSLKVKDLSSRLNDIDIQKVAAIITVCYVDLCKIETFVQHNESSVLHSIATDINCDLRNKIWTITNEFITTTTTAAN